MLICLTFDGTQFFFPLCLLTVNMLKTAFLKTTKEVENYENFHILMDLVKSHTLTELIFTLEQPEMNLSEAQRVLCTPQQILSADQSVNAIEMQQFD